MTSEAGLNDALAFPFVYFALAMAERGTQVENWIAQWLAVDVVYRLVVGGLAVGWLLGRLFEPPRVQWRLGAAGTSSVRPAIER